MNTPTAPKLALSYAAAFATLIVIMLTNSLAVGAGSIIFLATIAYITTKKHYPIPLPLTQISPYLIGAATGLVTRLAVNTIYGSGSLTAPSLTTIITLILTTVILAPIVEELIFREYLHTTTQSFLHNHNTPPVTTTILTILLPSLLFGIAHGDPSKIPLYTAIGTIFAATRTKTGNLTTPIITHATFNATGILFAT